MPCHCVRRDLISKFFSTRVTVAGFSIQQPRSIQVLPPPQQASCDNPLNLQTTMNTIILGFDAQLSNTFCSKSEGLTLQAYRASVARRNWGRMYSRRTSVCMGRCVAGKGEEFMLYS